MASAGCMKNDGVPVEASVALIFLQMMPDLPRPIVTTRPVQAAISSTASTKCWSRCSMSPRIAADSTSRTRFASAIAGCIRAIVSKGATRFALLRHEAVIEEGRHRRGDAALVGETDRESVVE